MTDETAAQPAAEPRPFELRIPVRIARHELTPNAPTVDITAAGGLAVDGGQVIVAGELRLRTGDNGLVGSLPLGGGFDLILVPQTQPAPPVG